MIVIFLDTNILHCSDNHLDRVRFSEKLQNIISEIEINDLYTEIKLVIPKMVLYELYYQQLAAYEEWINKLDGLDLPNMTVDKFFNYEQYLQRLFAEEIEEFGKKLVKVEIVDFPAESVFENIIFRALEKRPPFEGKEKQSDKGFKDVVIWECVKEYKTKHINDTIILYCNDNLLSDEKLKKEFEEEFRDKLYIKRKGNLVENLEKLCNKTLVKTFAAQLEERLIQALSCSNTIFYDLMMEDNVWSDGDEIIDFNVCELKILRCNDEKIDNKIFYDIELDLSLKYKNEKQREQYKYCRERTFKVYYDFEGDGFWLKEYDSLTLGRVERFEYVEL